MHNTYYISCLVILQQLWDYFKTLYQQQNLKDEGKNNWFKIGYEREKNRKPRLVTSIGSWFDRNMPDDVCDQQTSKGMTLSTSVV